MPHAVAACITAEHHSYNEPTKAISITKLPGSANMKNHIGSPYSSSSFVRKSKISFIIITFLVNNKKREPVTGGKYICSLKS